MLTVALLVTSNTMIVAAAPRQYRAVKSPYRPPPGASQYVTWYVSPPTWYNFTSKLGAAPPESAIAPGAPSPSSTPLSCRRREVFPTPTSPRSMIFMLKSERSSCKDRGAGSMVASVSETPAVTPNN